MTSQTIERPAPASRANRGNDSYDGVEPWLEKMAALCVDDPERARLRQDIIDRCLPLAEHVARRYTHRGEAFEDLYQTASLGLVLAVDRFDPTKSVPFVSFAVPTIMGEVRRHFRDHTWLTHVPRPVKELQADVGPATEQLAQRLHRMPKASELAAELGVDRVAMTQALIATKAHHADSIDGSSGNPDRDLGADGIAGELGDDDVGYRITEDALAVGPLLHDLPAREREVLRLRFFENWTQTQIGERIGVSQMQVCRILTTTLAMLRERALPD